MEVPKKRESKQMYLPWIKKSRLYLAPTESRGLHKRDD